MTDNHDLATIFLQQAILAVETGPLEDAVSCFARLARFMEVNKVLPKLGRPTDAHGLPDSHTVMKDGTQEVFTVIIGDGAYPGDSA